MKSEFIKPIYKLNGRVLNILTEVRSQIIEDPEKVLDMLDLSIKALSDINDELSVMTEIQQIIDTTTED